MARGINKVILVGNLGNDPEVRYAPSGTAMANINIATTSAWKDRQSGERHEKTEWHRVVFYNRLAEIVGEYLKKGSQIYIEGRLQTRKWQDKQSGQDRYTTEVVAAEMQMLGGRGGTGGEASYDQSAEPPSGDSGSQGNPGNPSRNKGGAAKSADDFDDDIPF